MKGLEISVTNSDLVIKQEEKIVKLFVIFKDKNGAQITKEVFLNKYPHFKRITNEWDSVKLK